MLLEPAAGQSADVGLLARDPRVPRRDAAGAIDGRAAQADEVALELARERIDDERRRAAAALGVVRRWRRSPSMPAPGALRSSWLRTRRNLPFGMLNTPMPSCASGTRLPSDIIAPARLNDRYWNPSGSEMRSTPSRRSAVGNERTVAAFAFRRRRPAGGREQIQALKCRHRRRGAGRRHGFPEKLSSWKLWTRRSHGHREIALLVRPFGEWCKSAGPGSIRAGGERHVIARQTVCELLVNHGCRGPCKLSMGTQGKC